jgi:formylglycine-generating enzyme required for sulfatase activity
MKYFYCNLAIFCFFCIHSMGQISIPKPNKPKQEKQPIYTPRPVRPNYSPAMSSRPTKPKLENNLLLVADSACVVTLTGGTNYTFSLVNATNKNVLIAEGEYLIVAIPANKNLQPFKNTLRASTDQLKVFPINFNKKPTETTNAQNSNNNPTPAKKEPRYKDAMVEEICNNLILAEGGTFQMGDAFNTNKNEPAHTVKLNSFYINKFEVTHRQFVYFLTKSNYTTDAQKNDGGYVSEGGKRREVNFGYDAAGKVRPNESTNEPVLYISWNDANQFCKWLSQQSNRAFRLPTEAEWEYAARGGKNSQGQTFAGTGRPEEAAWHIANSGQQTHAVGKLKPNELGLYDMSGNVWEWCADWFDKKYYKDSPEEDPKGPETGDKKVVRGGCWKSDSAEIRSVYRTAALATEGFYSIGFRIVTNNP